MIANSRKELEQHLFAVQDRLLQQGRGLVQPIQIHAAVNALGYLTDGHVITFLRTASVPAGKPLWESLCIKLEELF